MADGTRIDLPESREPLRDVASQVAKWTGLLGGLVTSATGFGIFTAVQGDALLGLLGAVPGVVALAGTVWASFRVARLARPVVTPLVDPKNAQGVRLVPEASAGRRV